MTFDKTMTSPGSDSASGTSIVWELRVVHPPQCARIIPLEAGSAWQVIGRGAEGIDHPTVSRAHLGVRRRGMVLQVRDEGSHNGTWLDGNVLGSTAAFVANDSVLRIGDALAVIELQQADGLDVDRRAIPGDAPSIRTLRRIISLVAKSSTHVLLQGETGSGKELAAREIHRLSGRGSLVTFNCAGLSAQLADSQLFGHEKGAFTGAERSHEGLFRRANGGTLFLDELAELDPAVQAKLLRVLETGEVQPLGSDRIVTVDTRVVAATHPDLPDLVRDGRFRRDLHARLALASAVVPPLRERRGDIPGWLARFEERWREDEGGEPLEWTPPAMESVLLAPWPDNLRGLDRVVYQLRLHHGAGAVVTSDVLESVPHSVPETGPGAAPPPGTAPAPSVRPGKPSKDELVAVLEKYAGSVRAVAKHFERDRRQIYRWMEAYELR